MHHVRQIRTPTCFILRCECGWTRQITRRQNALARTSKIEGAINQHLREAAAWEAAKAEKATKA